MSKLFRSDLKIIVLGKAGTGKTSFVNQWTKGTFNENYKATIVSEFGFKIFDDNGTSYRIQIWDLAGQDNNATVTKIFAKDSHGVVILSEANMKETRQQAIDWKNSVEEAASFMDGGKLPSILVENKADLLEDPNEGEEELNQFASDNGFVGSFRTSAKTGMNVNESMTFLIKNIIKRMEDIQAKESKDVFTTERKNVNLDPKVHRTIALKKERKGNCC